GAFASLVRERVGALLVAADPYFDTRRDRIIGFAERQRLPAIYQFREYAVSGGLLSYGVTITDSYRQYGDYAAKSLKGAKPADLPVLQPTKSELVIHMKTATALGITISDDLLSLADAVIDESCICAQPAVAPSGGWMPCCNWVAIRAKGTWAAAVPRLAGRS